MRSGQGCATAMHFARHWFVLGLEAAVLLLSACGGGSVPPAPPAPARMSAAAQAGEILFNDKSLSASGQQSCATCHVRARAFTADPATDHGLPVPLGGPNMDLPGFR